MNARLLFCAAVAGGATSPAPAQQPTLPPVRQLGRRLAVSADTFGNVFGIHQLSDGRVIVNDNGKRQLLLFDAAFSHPILIADSTTSTRKAYGAAPGGILPYRGDTTLFVDPVALSMLVIDPRGVIVRTVAPPQPADAPALTMALGNAAIDAAGRIVYRYVRASCRGSGCFWAIMTSTPDTSAMSAPVYALHDSVVILRGDLATHRIDTAGFVAIPYVPPPRVVDNPDGSATLTTTIGNNVIPIDDGWAVTADGSVALVRGLDYHIDWLNADGTRASTPRIAHEWQRLSDSDKTVILDSARRWWDSTMQIGNAQQAKRDSADRAAGRLVTKRTQVVVWPSPSDLPDYRPVISQPSDVVKADADNNLWIWQGGSNLILPGSQAGRVYDIVNREGKLVDRVQLPPQMTLAGFGPGVVYLTVREGAGTVIAKYRIH